MWCVAEREVNKCPHITLASLKAMSSDVMTGLDREGHDSCLQEVPVLD
jgi:hypothetical protein